MQHYDLEQLSSYWGPVHVHKYCLPTSINDEHKHLVRGRTSPAAGGLDEHTHYYEGFTTCENGHVHRYCGITGPAVACPGYGHSHEMYGRTSFDDGHIHYYRAFTGCSA